MKKMSCVLSALQALIVILAVGSGCRGWTSTEPPIHLNPNMDIQPKYRALKENDWFADKRDMRPLVPCVIARGQLKTDETLYTGKKNGQLINGFPADVVVDKALLTQGQNRFNIYCASCHDQTGSGGGLVGKRLPVKPASIHQDRLYVMPNGYFFDVITNGVNTMPALGAVVPVADRWAIVAYVRALQISQNADREWAWKQ